MAARTYEFTVRFLHRANGFGKTVVVEADTMQSAIVLADMELAAKGYASAAFDVVEAKRGSEQS